jgi:hypothetical protein
MAMRESIDTACEARQDGKSENVAVGMSLCVVRRREHIGRVLRLGRRNVSSFQSGEGSIQHLLR